MTGYKNLNIKKIKEKENESTYCSTYPTRALWGVKLLKLLLGRSVWKVTLTSMDKKLILCLFMFSVFQFSHGFGTRVGLNCDPPPPKQGKVVKLSKCTRDRGYNEPCFSPDSSCTEKQCPGLCPLKKSNIDIGCSIIFR